MRTSQYVYGGGLTWRQYLQARDFELSLREGLSESAASIVASNDVIAQHIQTSTTMVVGAIQELGAVFSWGFAEVLGALGAVNDSLRDLLRAARTPSQTWAYEQFEIARNAFRQGLYPESLRHLRQALEGFGSNAGYDLDFRFHYLEGIIRLGSFENVDPSILDPDAAERSFLQAARYARSESPVDVTRALVAASQAAYVQGKITAATAHATKALDSSPKYAEAHYQLAKCLMHQDNPSDARKHVSSALVADAEYALKMLSDADFGRHRDVLIECIEGYRDQVRARVSSRARAHQDFLGEIGSAAVSMNDGGLAQQATATSRALAAAESARTLMGLLAAEEAYEARRSTLSSDALRFAETLETGATATEQWSPHGAAYVAGVLGFVGLWNATCQAARSGWQAPSGCVNSLIFIALFGFGGVVIFYATAGLFHIPKANHAGTMRNAAQQLRSAAGGLGR